MADILKLEKFKEGKSTLAEMYEEISEGTFPFITFNTVTKEDGELLTSCTIPWARFREKEVPGLWEVRSCDCEEHKDERQNMFITKNAMAKFILDRVEGPVHYIFCLRV